MVDHRARIVNFVKMRGPSLPVHVAKDLDTNILMASAMLSELVSRHELKISNIKVGGSPLYYAPGQESRLQEYADRLNPKDRDAFELLRDRKILKDTTLEPIERVCLRQIKDFAIPLNVQIGPEVQTYWKWYLVPNAEAESLIKEMVGERKVVQPAVQPTQSMVVQPVEKAPTPIPPPVQQELAARLPAEPQPAKNEKEPEEPREQQKPQKREKRFVDDTGRDDFLEKLRAYCAKSKIEIIEYKIVRKNAEVDCVLSVPSSVGTLTYYCKAKAKKRSTENDLASAMVGGQMKKLPVLYLSTGELTKRAKEMLGIEFRGMTVKSF